MAGQLLGRVRNAGATFTFYGAAKAARARLVIYVAFIPCNLMLMSSKKKQLKEKKVS